MNSQQIQQLVDRMAFSPGDLGQAIQMALVSDEVTVTHHNGIATVTVYDPVNMVTATGRAGFDGLIEWQSIC